MCASPLASWKKEEWTFGSFSSTCSNCSREPKPGDTFYSVLAEGTEEASREEETEEEKENEKTEEGEYKEEDEEEGLFERRDFCASCWSGPGDDVYSFWKTEVPEKEEEDGETPDRSTLVGIWEGFREKNGASSGDGSTDELNINRKVDFLITLMLMRKGYLALEKQYREEGTKWFVVRVRGGDDEYYEIPEPEIGEDEVETITDELEQALSPGNTDAAVESEEPEHRVGEEENVGETED